MTTLSFSKGHIATCMKKPISLELMYKKVDAEIASVCSIGRQASCDASKLTQEQHTRTAKGTCPKQILHAWFFIWLVI